MSIFQAVGATRHRSSGGGSVFLTGNTTGGGGNGVVVYNWNPVSLLPNWIAAETAVSTGASPLVRVVCLGDSTVGGTTANPVGQSWPNWFAVALAAASGLKCNYACFGGNQEEFGNITLNGGATWNNGFFGFGSSLVASAAIGQGGTWVPEAGRLAGGPFDRLDIWIYDANAAATATVTVSGGSTGSHTVTIPAGSNTSNSKQLTVSIPSDNYTTVAVAQTTTGFYYWMGCGFWNSTIPAIQVCNFGVGGTIASFVGGQPNFTHGMNAFTGACAVNPKLVFINFGINDINQASYNYSTYAGYLAATVTALKAQNIDVIIEIPHPFIETGTPLFHQTDIVNGAASFATTNGVAVVDLNSTYGNAYTAFQGSTLVGSGVHPNSSGYQDFAQRIASLMTNTPQTYANSVAYTAAHPPVGTLD